MTLNAKRRRAHDKLAALPGVRPIRRPVTATGSDEFDLYYVRTGRKTRHPLVIIPGGPGAASIALYRGLRRRAAAEGLDVIMIEHRGVGMSRHDDNGADLPPEALTIEQVVDDVAAVLDDAQVDSAIIYGTSYGTYVAAGVGVRHPSRVFAMILDSPLLAGDDIEVVRQTVRSVLWHGREPDTEELADKVRRLADEGVMTPAGAQLAATVYGFGGARLLDRQLDLLLGGRNLVWTAMGHFGELMVGRKAPYRNEADLVGRIGYRELNYAADPDGLPLDPAVAMHEFAAGEATRFEAEPFDLVAEMPKFTWPTVVVSGGRDLITPPAVADRIAELIPGSVLVRLPTTGHSVLDTKERAALRIAEAAAIGRIDTLRPQEAALDAMPSVPAVRLMVSALAVAARVEAVLPASLPRVVTRTLPKPVTS
ncbi:alpha/beta hydrolase [Mycolicibacterium aromaticivorans JS19b1 = JCM 16368]|uniref:Alpha/beta hydrolase n=1 Tax=Mycolicibacterium aromaticivorans JS19b1 = JCM 16368 TaxID=1440774 RepID=A0A064CLA7_9MYCO|nr:alpha/beta fold hydrolase [Mycolicibacterium aromaticivorans]KDF01131.1 alpha/beta hydrolase [Mycolicibacterium aromaticivorans JS19b1 = JCM 16368]